MRDSHEYLELMDELDIFILNGQAKRTGSYSTMTLQNLPNGNGKIWCVALFNVMAVYAVTFAAIRILIIG